MWKCQYLNHIFGHIHGRLHPKGISNGQANPTPLCKHISLQIPVGLASADHECDQKYDLDIDISTYKVYTIITKVYKGILMTVKVEKSEYKKELFSLPMDVVETLKKYAEETHKKKVILSQMPFLSILLKMRKKSM